MLHEHAVAVLGPVELRSEGAPIPVGGTKIRAVLALLALEAGRAVPAETIVGALWGEEPPATASNAVQVYVAAIRKGLRAAGLDGALATAPRGYRLDLPDGALDRDAFLAARARGAAAVERGDRERASRAFGDALALWRGPAMYDLVELDAVRRRAEHLDELELTTFEAYAENELALGRADRLLPQLERRSEQHPLRESLWGLRALGAYRAGDQVGAIAALRTVRAALGAELGIDPGPSLAALEVAILRQDPGLLVSPARPAPAAPERRRERTVTVQRTDLDEPQGELVLPDGRRHALGAAPCSIGRDDRGDVHLADPQVSSRHARIYATATGHVIEDLLSRNGTIVNGQFVTRAALAAGDRIELGRSVLRYERGGSTTPS